jgi:hypothetical protein
MPSPSCQILAEKWGKVVLYLDDGFGMNKDESSCYEDAKFVKESLIEAGLFINEEISVFTPVAKLEWLGIVWNSTEFTLSITKRRVYDLMSSLCVILKSYPSFTARHLAQVVGRVISMTLVIGNVAMIKSKYCYMAIENRSAWDKPIMSFNQDKELRFWENNISKLNSRQLGVYSKSSVVIYSDVVMSQLVLTL